MKERARPCRLAPRSDEGAGTAFDGGGRASSAPTGLQTWKVAGAIPLQPGATRSFRGAGPKVAGSSQSGPGCNHANEHVQQPGCPPQRRKSFSGELEAEGTRTASVEPFHAALSLLNFLIP